MMNSHVTLFEAIARKFALWYGFEESWNDNDPNFRTYRRKWFMKIRSIDDAHVRASVSARRLIFWSSRSWFFPARRSLSRSEESEKESLSSPLSSLRQTLLLARNAGFCTETGPIINISWSAIRTNVIPVHLHDPWGRWVPWLFLLIHCCCPKIRLSVIYVIRDRNITIPR